MYKLIVLTVLVAAVAGNNITIGQNSSGRKVYDEKFTASPAIWRQVQSVTVNATEGEVISRVVVTDNRPNKDGEANISQGGVGQKNVTVELKSPTVFRGFDFNVEVYTIPENELVGNGTVLIDSDTDVHINKTQNPINDSAEVNVAENSTPIIPETTEIVKKEVNVHPAILGSNTQNTEIKHTKNQSNNSDLDSVLASIFPPNTTQLVPNGSLASTTVEVASDLDDHKTLSTPTTSVVAQNDHTTETSTAVNNGQSQTKNAKMPEVGQKMKPIPYTAGY